MVHRLLDLSQLLKPDRSAFLFGPRGTGKTSLAKGFLADNRHTFAADLLNMDTYRRYVTNPSAFRREVESALHDGKGILTVFLDEVQRIPDLLNEVHHLIELHKGKIRFLLSGSSARKLRREGANLLAGRAWMLHLHPLCSRELPLDLHRTLSIGALPGIYLDPQGATRTLLAYVETYLKEEVLQESLIRRMEPFMRFMDLAGQAHGEPINFSAIAKDAGTTTKTVQEYFSILVDTMLVRRIDGWSWSVRRQLSKSPKFYFFDCGILNAIRGELNVELKPSSYRYGKLFETFIINEIIRLNDYTEENYRMYYWRTSTNMEVDLILSHGPGDQPTAVEIKSKSDPDESDLKGLEAFASENPHARLLCLCQADKPYQMGKVKILPWQQGLELLFPSK